MGKVDAAAAQLATSALLERARSCDLKQLWEPKTWNRLFQEVDDIVLTDSAAGYTTLIGVVIHNQLLVGASVGDSASVIDTNGEVYDLTARQHKNPPVGSGTATATPFASKLQTPWRLVLMSDGVWKYAGWGIVKQLIQERGGSELVRQFRMASALPNGLLQDDFTVIVCESR